MRDLILLKLTIGLSIAFCCCCVAIGFLLFPQSGYTAQKTENVALNTLKLRARQAENSRDPEHEDVWYLQALTEAKKSGTKTDVLEILSRLVRERIDNHKVKQVDPFIQEALDLVKSLKGTRSYDPEMSVWMDDMADVLYSRGEHTANREIKEYCARRYLDIELFTADRFDPQLMSRSTLLSTSLRHQGRCGEAFSLGQETIAYMERTDARDWMTISLACYQQGLYAALTGHFDEANRDLLRAHSLHDSNAKKDFGFTAIIDRSLSLVCALRGDLPGAKTLCKTALGENLHLVTDGQPCEVTGMDEYLLGAYEQKSGNFTEAYQHYKASLKGFQNATNAKLEAYDNSGVASGKVMSLEALADCERRNGDKAKALLYSAQAKSIRAKHPGWSATKLAEPLSFYKIWCYLPYPIEVIPTRDEMPL